MARMQYFGDHRAWLLGLFLVLLAGCVAATPTYPSPYPPPQTPAPRPTPVATPLPTLTQMPYFPAEAAVPEGYPALPADLYFLREGRLWRWPAVGEGLEAVAPHDETAPVLGYWLANGSNRIGYIVAGNLLFVYDPLTGQHLFVPTRGELDTSFDRTGKVTRVPLQEYALTPDGRYLVYLGWGAAPGEAAGDTQSAAVLVVDLESPNHTVELAPCLSDMSSVDSPRPCGGFSLSPDGRQMAFFDKSGLWLADVPEGNARLLVERSGNIMPRRCDVNYPRALRWSPDGHFLLAGVGCYEGSYWTVVDVGTGRLIHFPEDTFCYVNCRNEAYWGPAGIWLGGEETGSARDWHGRIALFGVAGGELLEMARQITQTAAGPLRPISLYPFADGRVGFAQRGCVELVGPAPAVYLLGADGDLREVFRLPVESCGPEQGEMLLWESTWVTALWGAGGSAFLYLEEDEPVLLGQTDGAALWDVRELLRGAVLFRWVSP